MTTFARLMSKVFASFSSLIVTIGMGCCCLWAASASAAITITTQSITMYPMDTANIDIYISSNTSDVLDAFNLEFKITSSDGSGLKFTNPQPDGQLSDSNYLFDGNSLYADLLASNPLFLASSVSPLGDYYIGGDFSLDLLGVIVPTTPTLLLRLQVFGDLPAVGAVFNIEPTNALFLGPTDPNNPNTPIAYEATLDGGSVTIVPEPSSLLILCGLTGTLSLSCGRRQRQRV